MIKKIARFSDMSAICPLSIIYTKIKREKWTENGVPPKTVL